MTLGSTTAVCYRAFIVWFDMSGVTAFIDNARLDAADERADDSIESANYNVYEFVKSVVQQSWSLPTENDIKHIQYIRKASWDDGIITSMDDIDSVCMNTVGEFPPTALNGEPLYDEAQLAVHKMIPARGPQTKVASISRTGGYLFYTSHAPCKRKTGLQR